MEINPPLLTDLYQLTMAQGYWKCGKTNEEACFHLYFRENPFKGGFAIACGMSQVADLVENYKFSEEERTYLSALDAPQGGKLFDPSFLDYLETFKLDVDIDAVYEGTVVFPNEPLLRVTGSILHCQLLETVLLNCVGFQTLIATKAARVSLSAQAPVAEFGLRRAQGVAGGLWASRAAIVGGCASTSNVLAGKQFNVPVSGTHAHSWVMSFEDELEAFRAYAKVMPNNCVLLVDTYDCKTGIDNAITVGLEMKARGEKLSGIRIDSGDLAWLSKIAREKLDEAGLYDCAIVLSNDLDEYTIQSLRDQGARADSYGVGTKLATAADQPMLGAVYKLSAVKNLGESLWRDKIKISEQASKLTVPGVLDVRRYYHDDGSIAGDMVFDTQQGVDARELIIDPQDSLRQKSLKGKRNETLLHPLASRGVVVIPRERRDALTAQSRVLEQLKTLDETQKRILNPHSYPVGLECSLFERRHDLVVKLRDIQV